MPASQSFRMHRTSRTHHPISPRPSSHLQASLTAETQSTKSTYVYELVYITCLNQQHWVLRSADKIIRKTCAPGLTTQQLWGPLGSLSSRGWLQHWIFVLTCKQSHFFPTLYTLDMQHTVAMNLWVSKVKMTPFAPLAVLAGHVMWPFSTDGPDSTGTIENLGHLLSPCSLVGTSGKG